MRIWDAGHRWWLIGTLAASAVGAVVYYAGFGRDETFRSGSMTGLWLGIAGTSLMVFAAMLSVRRSMPARPWGSLRWWLRAHIWMGLLSAVLIAFHAGFSWGGPVEFALCVAIILVIGSGLWGWAAQEILPRMMTIETPLESFREQHEYQCRWLQFGSDRDVARVCRQPLDVEVESLQPFVREFLRRREADKSWQLPKKADNKKAALLQEMYPAEKAQALANAAGYKLSTTAVAPPPGTATKADHRESIEELRRFYVEQVRPHLDPRAPIRISLSSAELIQDEFHRLRIKLSETLSAPDVLPVLHDLEHACHVRLQFQQQARMHNWLHCWLLVHIPATIAAALLLLAHIITSLRVIPPY